jgi:hypothetical protein
MRTESTSGGTEMKGGVKDDTERRKRIEIGK